MRAPKSEVAGLRMSAAPVVNKLLLIREDSYGTQNLSYEIGIRDRGADESA